MNTSIEKNVEQIIYLLFKNIRQINDSADCQQNMCINCHAPHKDKIRIALLKKKPLQLVLPGFPAKSANREKTLSARVDLAEVMSLKNLNELCRELFLIHPEGVSLIICSDGGVFNDLVMVSEEDLNVYQQGIKHIISDNQLRYLNMFSLDDVYPDMDLTERRKELMRVYSEPMTSLKQQMCSDIKLQSKFNGIHRFIFEDQWAFYPSQSNNQLRNSAKEVAYEVVSRSNAWSKLLAEYFPDSIRLSIHPQHCGSEKLGIQFLSTSNGWATPWHNVLMKKSDGWELIKRIEAEQLGARLNHDHYLLEAI